MGTSNKKNANSASLEETSLSRSLLARLGFLRSRTRNVAEFHIRPFDPHRRYSAGDHVQGAVILTVLKPLRITHLTVSLHGYVRVFRGPTSGASEPAINPAEIPSESGSHFKYHGNGFASLFHDEQVLSADGRLEVGKYEFNFNLLFPSKGLPSSIDFERGTISYMITATLTRPTSLSATQSCETKIYLLEKVDVGPIQPPRPRTIYLEPIPKKSRKRKHTVTGFINGTGTERGSAVPSGTVEPASDFDSTRVNENSTDGSLSVVGEDSGHEPPPLNPRSPVQVDGHSELSREGSGTGSGSGVSGLSRGGEQLHHRHTNNHNRDPGLHQNGCPRLSPGVEDRTITATIELLRGGCLPGDMISVKISVQHIKRIKSLHGVIVTLYRQGRIDSAPPLSQFKGYSSKEDAKALEEKEDYYPKSRTGLGGLSLSSAGSCSVFRKDLSQAFSPLIIDPLSLTASVTASVRVPEDAFPTIRGVPGEMITFKYQLEVIVDLGGKLASQIQSGQWSNSRVGTRNPPVILPLSGNPYELGAATLAHWGGSLIDTDRLRREKGVISIAFEVVVGTTDSLRGAGGGADKGAGKGKATASVAQTFAQQTQDPNPQEGTGDERGQWPNTNGLESGNHGRVYGSFPPDALNQYSYDVLPEPPELTAPFYVPPPEILEQSGLSEKERIRQADLRLLPSQPMAVAEVPDVGSPDSPSVLYPDSDNIYDAEDEPEAGSSSRPVPIPPPTHPASPTYQDSEAGGAREAPTAPTLEELYAGRGNNAADDKQELERQRLLAEASAPPEFPDDYDAEVAGVAEEVPAALLTPSSSAAPPPSHPLIFEPSAPILSDDEGYGPQYSYQGIINQSRQHHAPSALPSEDLPRYER